MARGKSQCAPEVFVKAWQKAESVEAVMKELGITETSAHSRSSRYRRAGVPLKNFPRGGGARLDIKGLAALAKGLAPKEAASK